MVLGHHITRNRKEKKQNATKQNALMGVPKEVKRADFMYVTRLLLSHFWQAVTGVTTRVLKHSINPLNS